MNANDIQTLHAQFSLSISVPQEHSKLFWLKYDGLHNLMDGIPTQLWAREVKGIELTYRNGDLWITTMRQERLEQRKYPKNTIEGNCPEFICSWDTRSGQNVSLPYNFYTTMSHKLLLILLDLRDGTHYLTLAPPIGPQTFRPMGGTWSWNKGSEYTMFLPRFDLNRTCRTWAVSGEIGKDLVNNITGMNTRHAPYDAVIHGRPSNIGVTYYDSNGGDFVDTKPLAQRYSSKYIGRTTSWNEVTKTTSIMLTQKDFSGIKTAIPLSVMEIHFPRNAVEEADGDADIFGNAARVNVCGYTLITNRGELTRVIVPAPFKKGHPLTESMHKTRFKEVYTPEQLQVDYWNWVTEVHQGDDELNNEQKEMVSKWFSGYITNMIRKGETPSDEEIEYAKKLGIYKGD